MRELAHHKRFKKLRNIEQITEFRNHLEREGITFEEWERRNKATMPDMEIEALTLQARHVEFYLKR